MSLKPAKKSDRDKGWMTPRRDNPKRIRPEYHLIVTEGIRTEPAYFEGIKAAINRDHPERIQLEIVGAGCNTLTLFQKARQLARASANGYKHVWVVYDTDDFPAEHINETARLCEEYSDAETKYHAIWSNQCIEIWFLLHFSFLQTDIRRELYYQKLSRQLSAQGLGEYRKNRTDMFQVLLPYLDNAIENAKRLDVLHEGKAPADSAPGTKVYQLVEILKPYLVNTENLE